MLANIWSDFREVGQLFPKLLSFVGSSKINERNLSKANPSISNKRWNVKIFFTVGMKYFKISKNTWKMKNPQMQWLQIMFNTWLSHDPIKWKDCFCWILENSLLYLNWICPIVLWILKKPTEHPIIRHNEDFKFVWHGLVPTYLKAKSSCADTTSPTIPGKRLRKY